MAEQFDYIHKYIMGVAQMLIGFVCFSSLIKKKPKIIYFIIFGFLCIIEIRFNPLGGIIEFFIYIAMLTLWGRFIYKTPWIIGGLYSVIVISIMELFYGIGNSVIVISNQLLLKNNIMLPGIVFAASDIIVLTLFILSCIFIKKHFLYFEAYSGKYALLILIPVLMIFLIGQYINLTIYGNIITVKDGELIVDYNPYQMLIIESFAVIGLFCIMFAYKKLLENFKLNAEIITLKQQERYLAQYVGEITERYEKTRSFRHDIINHMSVVSALISERKYDKAKEYLREMNIISSHISPEINTGNPVIDILLKEKFRTAAENGITVKCNLALPYPCNISDIDLCIVISNAVDNAINACKEIKENKMIKITNNIQGELIALLIKNSYFGNKNIKEGIGISNIRAVTEKYGGMTDIIISEDAFILKILLIIPQP